MLKVGVAVWEADDMETGPAAKSAGPDQSEHETPVQNRLEFQNGQGTEDESRHQTFLRT